jgi:hypothetical protein
MPAAATAHGTVTFAKRRRVSRSAGRCGSPIYPGLGVHDETITMAVLRVRG